MICLDKGLIAFNENAAHTFPKGFLAASDPRIALLSPVAAPGVLQNEVHILLSLIVSEDTVAHGEHSVVHVRAALLAIYHALPVELEWTI